MVQTAAHADPLIATGISREDYLARYAATFHEWVRGDVIKTSPVSGRHDDLTGYLREIFRAYFALRPSRTRPGDVERRLALQVRR